MAEKPTFEEAKKALIEKEALFRGLFDHMTSGAAVYEVRNDGSKGADYIIREFNRISLKIEGKKLEEILGKSLFDLRPNIDDYGLIPVMKKVWETGIPEYFPAKIYQDDSFSNYYENQIFKLPSGEVVTIYNDVTDQKNQEKKLKESEEKFRLMAENMSDVITLMDMNFRFTYISPSIKRLTGFSVEEALKFSIEDIIPPDSFQQVLNIIEEEITAEASGKNDPHRSRIIEYQQYRKDKSIIWVESNCRFLRDRDQKISGFLVISRDITERKQTELEKEKLREQLTQAQKLESVGRLAGGVAHDFNNMLGVILGRTELALLQIDENHDLYAELKEIQKAAQRSADITKQLLAFARKQTISPRQLDLNDTVESMLNMLRRLIGEDIDLVWQPATYLWPVKMDPSQIDQILANLCVNARDAIAGGGKITIETEMKTFDPAYRTDHQGFIPGDFVMLAVSDNGCGMDKQTLNKLFEPFFTTKDVGEGTGLGLATVYGIVKQNNGFINVYSEPDQGAVFKIYLPRYLSPDETAAVVHPKKPSPGGDETILLVEDEPAILRMTRMMLERKGYSVLSAVTPAEAIDLAKTHSDDIDLLMTDVVMPEMNGRDLAGQLTAICPDIKLLFMSGYTANVIARHGVLDDGVAFIQKPFSMKELAEKLRQALDEPGKTHQ